MALKEFKVLVSGISVAVDKEGKNVQRFLRDEIVKLDDSLDSVKRFLDTKVLGSKDDEDTTAADLAAAVSETSDTPVAPPVDAGTTTDATPPKS